MSGPKTSQLTLEQLIQMRLASARQETDQAIADAIQRIQSIGNDLLARSAQMTDASDMENDIERAVRTAENRLYSECRLTATSSIDGIEAAATRCKRQAASILEGFTSEMAPIKKHIEEHSEAHSRFESNADFAQLLRDAACAQSERDKGASNSASASDSTSIPVAQGTSSEEADHIQETARKTLSLLASEALPAQDRSVLLRAAMLPAEEMAAQIAPLLPDMEANEQAMKDLTTQAKVLASRFPQYRLPRFASLDEAQCAKDELEKMQAEADRDAYIQACIDEVMTRHGYDIAHSVTMGAASTSGHRLYSSDTQTETNICSFLSKEGDLMLQIAGANPGEDIQDGDAISLDIAQDASDMASLLDAQTNFCAVYDEISDELAEFGITNKVVNREAPATRYCRIVSKAESSTGQSAGIPKAFEETDAPSATRKQRQRRQSPKREAREMR